MNWLDAIGLLIELIGVIALTALLFKTANGMAHGDDVWPWSILGQAAILLVEFTGYAVRRLARHERIVDLG